MSDPNLERTCVRLRKDDLKILREMARSGSSLSFNGIIRNIVHSYVVQFQARERAYLDQATSISAAAETVDIEL